MTDDGAVIKETVLTMSTDMWVPVQVITRAVHASE